MKKRIFNILKTRGLDCFRNCLINLINYHCNDYLLSFIDMFSFQFQIANHTNISIGQRLYNATNHEIERYAKEFYGIERKIINCIPNDNHIIIRDTLDAYGPVLITAPANKCVWLPGYESQQVLHSFIIIDEDNDFYKIADPFYFTDILVLERHKVSFIEICSIHNLNIGLPDYDHIVNRARKEIEKQLNNHDFSYFISSFEELEDLSNEYPKQQSPVNINWVSGLDRELGFTIAGSRGLYADFLMYISDYTKDKKEIYLAAKRSKQIETSWIILRNRLLHNYTADTYNERKTQIINMLIKINNEECSIREGLLRSL